MGTAALLLVPLTRRELAAAVTRSNATVEASSSAAVERSAAQITWSDSSLWPPVGPSPGLRAAPGRLVVQCAAAATAARRPHPARLLRPETPTPAQDPGVRAEPRRHRERRARGPGTGETERLVQASLGGLISLALFFIVNLMNPRWMAFGDVRLSLVFGFGLAWVSPMDLFEAFLYAKSAGTHRRRRPHRHPPSGPQVRAALRPLHGAGRWAGPAHCDNEPGQRLGRVRGP